MLTGRDVQAQAQSIGLVSKVVSPAALLEACYGVAQRIAGFSQLGVELNKQMLWAGMDAGSLHSHMNHEGHAQLFLRMTTRNFEEAITARAGGAHFKGLSGPTVHAKSGVSRLCQAQTATGSRVGAYQNAQLVADTDEAGPRTGTLVDRERSCQKPAIKSFQADADQSEQDEGIIANSPQKNWPGSPSFRWRNAARHKTGLNRKQCVSVRFESGRHQ